MNIENVREQLKTPQYCFLKENNHLGKNIILLAVMGSHAYGIDKPDSDIDLRGVALNNSKEILLSKDFEQVVESNTDTTIYSFNKLIKLLSSNNPNTMELLGCLPEHYVYKTILGEQLIENRKLFISKLCINTFGAYAGSQLRRLENFVARESSQEERERHILKSIENAKYSLKERYLPYEEDSINLYIDKSNRDGYNTEIFMDIKLDGYPLRDWTGLWNELKSIVSSYNKIGKRNETAISHNKLGKHMGHLIRLYLMCIDMLEKGEIVTYRAKEHNLLMDLRNKVYLDEDGKPKPEFYDILSEYEKRLEYAVKNTSIPDLPDYKKINEFRAYVNELIVKGIV